MFTAPVLLSVSGSAGMLLLGADTEQAGNAVASSDPIQKIAYVLAALTTLAGLLGLFRALCKLLGARPVASNQSRPCQVCNDAPLRTSNAASPSAVCDTCGSGSSGPL